MSTALIMAEPEEKIYTVKEVAAILRVTVRTIRFMIADGELDAFKVRSEWRIKQSALQAIMQSREREEEQGK